MSKYIKITQNISAKQHEALIVRRDELGFPNVETTVIYLLNQEERLKHLIDTL